MRTIRLALQLLLPMLAAAGSTAAQGDPLVQIGAPGAGNAALALAPAGWRGFARDAVFLAGSSAATDWPYVHPGPRDAWAGSREHVFRIVVDLASVRADAAGEIELGVLDTHASLPPELELSVDGTTIGRCALPAGGGDASIDGHPEAGKRCAIRVDVPAGTFHTGRNVIAIANRHGSWFLYEHVTLRLPGASVAAIADSTFVAGARAAPGVIERDDRLWLPLALDVVRTGPARELTVRADGTDLLRTALPAGRHDVEVLLPAAPAGRDAVLDVDGQALAVRMRAVPELTIYVVPHSHTDIGYTHLQAEVERRQVENLRKGMAVAAATVDYPAGARFVWNVEVLWAADLFLQRMGAAERDAFAAAVHTGQVALNGLYLNILSGLARPEELVQSTRLATRLAAELGVPIDAAMISDIPGHTWGIVPALAQAGIRYLSTSPNYFDRIGTVQVASADQPFWWVGPSGRDRVLTWNSWMGYALSHTWGARLTDDHVAAYLDHLAAIGYPYDVTYIRWSGLGDNAEPDGGICDAVRAWNARFRWPRFVISDQRAPFVALEQRYGAQLPVRRGDWTPYWEDGAGSSARETAMNRASADRMTAAETVWALRSPEAWPVARADAAWRQVLLYTEHTWGAWNSVSQPDAAFVRAQWDVKRGYAEDADRLSRELLADASPAPHTRSAFDVVNTLSWARTDLVRVPASLSRDGDRVLDARGTAVPSQRLSTGELAVLVVDLPPFAMRRYRVVEGNATPPDGTGASASGTRLDNGAIAVALDPGSGDVTTLTSVGEPGDFVDAAADRTAFRYLFMAGSDASRAVSSGPATIAVGERGPLVASLVVRSDAPGVTRLTREVAVTAGLDRVELRAVVDKLRAPAGPDGERLGSTSKESVSFAFPFRVPDGQVRLGLPLGGVIRPDADQIAGSCKNWFTVGDWADVASDARGITLVTLDTPLIQVGGLTANLLNSQADPAVWRASVAPTQALFSWVMNNHWGTNYRAFQEGPVAFRFALRPHGAFDAADAHRLATGLAQPLLALPAAGAAPDGEPRLRLSNDRVVAVAFKPADDHAGFVLRLQNLSDRAQQTGIEWTEPRPSRTFLSDTSESRGPAIEGPVAIPAWGLVTLRADA
ncbi:MAG: hypothetical protein IPM29_31870 [Planctomycetes bacterium]|nr:hypothetical protein [Planctomycetota bacterium]